MKRLRVASRVVGPGHRRLGIGVSETVDGFGCCIWTWEANRAKSDASSSPIRSSEPLSNTLSMFLAVTCLHSLQHNHRHPGHRIYCRRPEEMDVRPSAEFKPGSPHWTSGPLTIPGLYIPIQSIPWSRQGSLVTPHRAIMLGNKREVKRQFEPCEHPSSRTSKGMIKNSTLMPNQVQLVAGMGI